MKRPLLFFGMLALAAASCWAQEQTRRGISVQGSGFIGKPRTGWGVQKESTNSGGLMAGHRFDINRWLAKEGDHDLSTDIHGVTGVGVVKLPALANMKPVVLVGGGALFDPRNTPAVERQTPGTFVYGEGSDVRVMRHVGSRAQYCGFVYKRPDFGLSQLKNEFTHAAVPSAGLVFRF